MNEPPEMAQDLFDYPKMVETALRGVMREGPGGEKVGPPVF